MRHENKNLTPNKASLGLGRNFCSNQWFLTLMNNGKTRFGERECLLSAKTDSSQLLSPSMALMRLMAPSKVSEGPKGHRSQYFLVKTVPLSLV